MKRDDELMLFSGMLARYAEFLSGSSDEQYGRISICTGRFESDAQR